MRGPYVYDPTKGVYISEPPRPSITTSDPEEAFAVLSQQVQWFTAMDHFMDLYMRAVVRHGMYGHMTE